MDYGAFTIIDNILITVTYVYIVRIHMFIYTYVYIVQTRPFPPIPRSCHAHKVDISPAFQQYHAEEIGYTTPIIFNWVVGLINELHSDNSILALLGKTLQQ